MENYNIHSNNAALEALKALVAEGEKFGFDVAEYLEKITRLIKDKELRIVLLGSVSDGKTSVIAGLLGKVKEDMKIDYDESSDELCFYQPEHGIRIIDTPGLFGTKEKEVDGKNVKFSHITENYISEAHIIIYVCSAVGTLKDSHAEIIRKVMRDYNKLGNTIFVINKMDNGGYDITDEMAFERGKEIKTQALIQRLRETINLTPDEEKGLHVVCLSADPFEEGLTYWFEQMEEYNKTSHIKDLDREIADITKRGDAAQLQQEAEINSANEVIEHISDAIEETNKPMQRALRKVEDQMTELRGDQKELHSDLIHSFADLNEMLLNIQKDTLRDIKGASVDTIDEVIDNSLGEEDGKVTFHILDNKINVLIRQCCECNAEALGTASVKLEEAFNKQESMIEDAMGQIGDLLKNVQVNGNHVKAARNMFAKNLKFKPWGAVKAAKNINKGLAVFGVGLEIYDWIKKFKEGKKLANMKEQLGEAVKKRFKELFASLADEEEYYKNYAPTYLSLRKAIQEREEEIAQMKQRVEYLEAYKQRIDKWRQRGEYVDFEEV